MVEGKQVVEPLCNLERAYWGMDKHGLDALCAVDARNVYYLSNFDSNIMWNWTWVAFAVLPRDRQSVPTLVCSGLDLPTLLANPTWMSDIRIYALNQSAPETAEISFRPAVFDESALGDIEAKALDLYDATRAIGARDPDSVLSTVLAELNLAGKAVGIDDMRMAGRLNAGAMARTRFVDSRDIMREIRLIKTPREIELMRDAAVRNERSLQAAIDATEPGILWRDIVEAFKIATIREGGSPTYLIRGAGELAAARTQVSDYAIKSGDLIFYDALATYRHYHGDIGRTGYVGEAPSDVHRSFSAMRAAWDDACRTMRPGMRASELSEQIKETVRKAGTEHALRTATPHSLGLEHFDHPQDQNFYQDFVIEEGCVLNVDMPHVEFGWGSMHLEDTVVVRADGPEFLTSNRTNLVEIGV